MYNNDNDNNHKKTGLMLGSFLLVISVLMLGQGCMSANQLAAEQAFYQSQTDIKKAEMQFEAEKIKAQMAVAIAAASASNSGGGGVGVIQIFNSGDTRQAAMPQYAQKDPLDKLWTVVDRGLSVGLPFLGAWGIAREVSKSAGGNTSVSNYGSDSTISLSGDRTASGVTFGNDGAYNTESQLPQTTSTVTSVPTTSTPLATE